MATQTKNRLGDILISKGLITPEQLNIAITEQKKRRQHLAPHDLEAQASIAPIGEILVELGFIDNMQLKRGLGWQSVVRKVTLAMSLCAPLMTVSYQAVAATVALPAKIEAESYSAMLGVQIQNTTDVGGGKNVGFIDTKDWMSYNNTSVNIPTTGSYKITYRVASESGGGKLELREAGTGKSYDSFTVPSTGGWQTWTTITRTVTLPAGVHNFEINALIGGFNVNWFQIEKVASSSSSSVSSAAVSSSSSSKSSVTSSSSSSSKAVSSSSSSAAPVVSSSSSSKTAISSSSSSATPVISSSSSSKSSVASSSSSNSVASTFSQTIQAENYTSMSGVQNESTTDTGGGQNTGYIETGDWMSYSGTTVSIPVTGSYKISYRVASESGGGSLLLQESSTGATLDTVPIASTGGWQTWVTVERTITLTAGAHSFNLKAAVGGFNVNWFKIESLAASSSSAATSSASSITASNNLPLTIKAQSFSAMSGVQTETTTDTGGGLNVGYIDASDWLDFSNSSVNIPKTGTYKISYRVASESGGGSFTLNEAGKGTVYDTISAPYTGGWQNWTTVERIVTLPAGVHKFGITAITGGFNINWFKVEQISTTLPFTIEAEGYSAMSGIQTEATTDTGGGLNVGYIDTGDWLTYSDTTVTVAATGTYTITYRVASSSGGGSFSLNDIDNTTPLDVVSVPSTGSWQNWVDVKHNITLTAGTHTFKINTITGGFNLNWFKIDNAASGGATGGSTTTSSSSSSSTAAVSSSSSSKSSTVAISSSSSSSSASTTTSGGVVSTQVAGPVNMSWTAPTARQDGSKLDITEIAGYEIRYKVAGSTNFTYISINDAFTNTYNFAWLEGSYVFQIAAFDKNGLYSDFVNVVSQ